MGQKVNPVSMRMGINKYWESTWFEKKHYSTLLKEDHTIRSYIEKNYAIAGISSSIRIHIITEWLRLCRRPLLSTDNIRYYLLVTSERCLERGRDRNGAPRRFYFL